MEFTERQKWALNEFDKLSRSLAKPGYKKSDVQAGKICGVSSSTICSIRAGNCRSSRSCGVKILPRIVRGR